MIKVLNARPADTFKLEIDFSDHTQGVFDAGTYLSTRSDNSTTAHALPVATQSADQLTVTEAKKWRKLQRLSKAA